MKIRAIISTSMIALSFLVSIQHDVEAQEFRRGEPELSSVLELQISPDSGLDSRSKSPPLEPLPNFQDAESQPPLLMSPDEVELEPPLEDGSPGLAPADPQGNLELAPFFEEESGPDKSESDKAGSFKDMQDSIEPYSEADRAETNPSIPAPPPSILLKPKTTTPQLGIIGKLVPGYGFAIAEVLPGSAAAKMKLETGDIILNINGRSIDSIETIQRELIRSQGHFAGEGLIRIDNIRARLQSKCNPNKPHPTRFIWLRFQM